MINADANEWKHRCQDLQKENAALVERVERLEGVIERKIAAEELHGKMQIAETRKAVETENKLIAAEAVIEKMREHLGNYDSETIQDWTDDIVHEFYAGFEALLTPAPATEKDGG